MGDNDRLLHMCWFHTRTPYVSVRPHGHSVLCDFTCRHFIICMHGWWRELSNPASQVGEGKFLTRQRRLIHLGNRGHYTWMHVVLKFACYFQCHAESCTKQFWYCQSKMLWPAHILAQDVPLSGELDHFNFQFCATRNTRVVHFHFWFFTISQCLDGAGAPVSRVSQEVWDHS